MTVPQSAALTDTGKVREHNEDAILESDPIFAVADGVGGAAAGELASGIALKFLGGLGQQIVTSPDIEDALEFAVTQAHQAIREYQRLHVEHAGMSTTITAAVVLDGGRIVLAHVGDSRAYRISGSGIEQLTDDHSVVGELVRSGRISSEQAARHPQRNLILRALGTDEEVDVDTLSVTAEPGEWFLLCSDGLSGLVRDEEIADVVRGSDTADEAATRLVDLANERGGTDNISVVLFQPLETGAPPHASKEDAGAATGMQTTAAALTETTGEEQETRGEQATGTQQAAGGTTGSTDPTTQDAPRTRRRLFLLGLLIAAVALAAFVWSQSYYFVQTADGRVALNHGFPVAYLHDRVETTDIPADAISEDSRERLLESYAPQNRRNADRLLAQLEEEAAGALADDEPIDGTPAPKASAPSGGDADGDPFTPQ